MASRGFLYTLSLYGVIYNPESMKPEYRRIEVFMDDLPTQEDVGGIKNFFTELIPYQYYTIWAYNTKVKEIVLVEGWL